MFTVAKPVRSRALGKKLLLSVVIGATPVVGASQAVSQDFPQEEYAQAEVGAQERLLFEQAAQSGNAARINAFIRAYPGSRLVRRLLVNLPPETLSLVDRSTLNLVSPTVIRSLPVDTRSSLGVSESGTAGGDDENGSRGSTISATDGYAG